MPNLSETIRSSMPKPQGSDGISPEAMRRFVKAVVPTGDHSPRIIDRTPHLTALAPIRKTLFEDRPLRRVTAHSAIVEF